MSNSIPDIIENLHGNVEEIDLSLHKTTFTDPIFRQNGALGALQNGHELDEVTSALNQASLLTTHDSTHAFDAVVPPIVQTSLFTFSGYDQALSFYKGNPNQKHWYYSRIDNPTVRHFEEVIAKLEGTEDALAFGSGMAAISAVVLTLLEPGDKMIVTSNVYNGAYKFFETFLKQYKIQVVYVNGLDLYAIEKALIGAKLFFIESPTSWTIDALNVKALIELAKNHGVLTSIDNSWATPIFQKPIEFGVDLIIHTATKYLGGHSDVIAGVVAGSKPLIEKIKKFARTNLGGILSPIDAWLLIRGLRTLPVRIQQIGNSALEIAKRLTKHPFVEEVKHPGLKKLPEGLLGTTGLFSFVLKEEVDIRTFINSLKVIKLGISWGGHESLIFPSSIQLQAAKPNPAIDFGLSPRLIRLNVGLEGTEVLYEDLRLAINLAIETSKLSNGV